MEEKQERDRREGSKGREGGVTRLARSEKRLEEERRGREGKFAFLFIVIITDI